MPDKFDPYREALVVETKTIWPPDVDVDASEREKIATTLQSDPENAGHLEYVRTHTGFCRQITVQLDDVERLRS